MRRLSANTAPDEDTESNWSAFGSGSAVGEGHSDDGVGQ